MTVASPSPDRLAIYRLRSADTSTRIHLDAADRIFGLRDKFKLSDTQDGRALHGESGHVVEIARASGGMWAANEKQLWNPSIRPELPGGDAALTNAAAFLRGSNLLPNLAQPFRLGPPVVGGTHFAMREDGRREDRQLDVQIVYPVLVGDLPVVGGGGDFTVVFGDRAQIVGFHGVWRPTGEAFEAKVIP